MSGLIFLSFTYVRFLSCLSHVRIVAAVLTESLDDLRLLGASRSGGPL